jgi:hypothetical protein
MDDQQLNSTTAPRSARWRSWTPRIILWTLASVVGLWLGTGTRTVAAGGQASRPVATAQAAIADIFRFDILLAGKEKPAAPVHPKAAPAVKCELPEAVLFARLQRPEPVASVMPKTLSNSHRPWMFAPPAKPAGAWRMKLEEKTAMLEHTQENLKAALATVSGLSAADRKSIQVELDKACDQIGAIRMQQWDRVPGPPELPVRHFGSWSESGAQLMP